MAARVSVIIPTWNGLHLLQRFLPSVIEATESFLNGENSAAEIIVVDDGSVDNTAEWLISQSFVNEDEGRNTEELKPSLGTAQESVGPQLKPGAPDLALRGTTRLEQRLIRNAKNMGFGYTCNRGFREAKNRLVMLVNNDVELDHDCIRFLAENFNEPGVFAAHCRVFDISSGVECGTGKLGSFANGFIRVHRSYIPRTSGTSNNRYSAPLFSMFATGGSAMFDREKFLELGGFEPLLAPFYWEDVELSYRAWKHGYQVVYEPRAIARHQISSTIGKLESGGVWRIQQRNRLIYQWIDLHDPRMFASHLVWLFVLFVTAPLRLRPRFWLSVADALRSLPEIKKRRKQERLLAKRSDREIFSIFDAMANRGDLAAYDRRSELKEG